MPPRVLIVQPYIGPVGGGNAVTSWTLQALRDHFRITVACLESFSSSGLNTAFGTSLRDTDFDIQVAPSRYLSLKKVIPTRGALFECNAVLAWARRLDRRQKFDVLLCLQNEADFGRPGIQYIHYPCWYLPRPESEMRWFHRLPGMLAAYRGICFGLSGATLAGVQRNLTLCNSHFVAGRHRKVHGQPSVVVPPPVPGNFPHVEWHDRRAAIVGIGRFSDYKRWPWAVEAVDELRARGFDLGLTLIGQVGDLSEAAELGRLQTMAKSRPWFRILRALTREQLAQEVAMHRYGLHAMEEEHFGIAVAELQRAGCIPFVHNSGGPPEIVGNRPELIFRDPADAAAKIAAVLQSAELETELRNWTDSRRDVYSAERFCSEMRGRVTEFAAGKQVSVR